MADWQGLTNQLGSYVPSLLGALAILVVGWIVALVAAAIVRGALHKTTLDNRIAQWIFGEEKADRVDVEGVAGKTVFWVLMIFVLVAFFQALGLTLVTQPLNSALSEISAFAPRLLGAAVLLLVAWIVASAARLVLKRVLGAARVDQRLGGAAGPGEGAPPVTQTLADTVYWLVLLLFLPAVLGALALEGLLTPVQTMLNQLLGYLPNFFAAGLILVVGWFVARILQRVVTNLLATAGADRLSEAVGLAPALGRQRLSAMLGVVVQVFVLIPVVVAALNALQLEAVSRPASNVLNQILGVLPNVFAAIVVVLIAYVIGRLVAGLVTNLLSAAGFNVVLARLGVGKEPREGERTPSEIVGFVVLVAVMLLAGMEAFRLLGFVLLADLIAQFNLFASKLLLGLVVLAIGLFLAKLVHDKVAASGTANAGFLALLARAAILVVAAAMAIQQVGVGAEVVNLILACLLGAVAVAAALAFGLGARESAGRLVEEWLRSLRGRT